MVRKSNILDMITLFIAIVISGCATSGSYKFVYNESELPSIQERYSSELSKLKVGMAFEDFRRILPDAYPVMPYEKTEAYELVDLQVYVTQADIDQQNSSWLFGTPQPRKRKTILRFYFSDNKLLKWGKPSPRETAKGIEEGIEVGNGTCFAISKDGLIVTAYHVIEGATKVNVNLSQDSSAFAKVIHQDPMNDLAVLKIENSTPNFLRIAPIRSARTGDRVFTMGFPVSSLLGEETKYTEGVISSLSGVKGAASLLQITVPVQPGNSGGPLVNESGEVVGIITSSAAILPFIKESGTLPQNVNWAIKADYLRPMIELPEVEQQKLTREQLIAHVQKSSFRITNIK